MREAVAVSIVDRNVSTNAGEFDFARRAVVLGDRGLNAGFGNNDWFDVKARHELDVVHGKDIRRIDHREGEGGAYARQR